jgi:hypothetical protein
VEEEKHVDFTRITRGVRPFVCSYSDDKENPSLAVLNTKYNPSLYIAEDEEEDGVLGMRSL